MIYETHHRNMDSTHDTRVDVHPEYFGKEKYEKS
jgi:hypothetical protein